MKTLLFIAALLSVTCWYASSRFTLADALVYAKKNPAASWAPAADYYVGLAYYQRAEYPQAQEAFTQLLADYTTGPYTARGLLRLSLAAEENRDWPVARQSLERFIEEFPDHKEKGFAEQRLELIKYK